MKLKNKTFDKSFWKSFGWFLFLVIIICCLPWVLTRGWLVDFSDTCEIGDTLGGIMGPFVAITAVGLTFIAFWVQYKANIQQRQDIAIERQEAKFYKMLDIYSDMTNGLEIHGIKGKEAFAELVGEFTFTFFAIDEIYKTIICDKTNLANSKPQIKSIVDEFSKDVSKYIDYITNLSYNLFFYGKHYVVVDIAHPEKTTLGEEIKKIAFGLNRVSGMGTFSDYVKGGSFEIQVPNPGLSSPLYEGHSDFLGHYYRHLFQMVKYVSSLDDSLFDEETKAGYVKLLRAQMSDYEQILLYYNSLSEQGTAWNIKHGDNFPEETGYISRYSLIKNWPPNFTMFGVLPINLYKEDSDKWKEKGKRFFEHTKLPISKSVGNWNH